MMYRTLVIIGLSSGLAGCISLLPSPKPAAVVYRLDTDLSAVAPNATAEVVRVDRPTAPLIYGSSNIIATVDGKTLTSVALSNWSESMPFIVQNSLVTALEGSAEFVGVTPTSGARTQTRVHLTIGNFEANFDNGEDAAPLAVVKYRVTYARADDRELIGTYNVSQTHRADSINVSSIVDAMETANQAAMVDVVNWLQTQRRNTAS